MKFSYHCKRIANRDDAPVIRHDMDCSTLAVSNPGHAMWTRADPEHTDAAPGDTYGHLLRLDGPPEFEPGLWEPGDGIL